VTQRCTAAACDGTPAPTQRDTKSLAQCTQQQSLPSHEPISASLVSINTSLPNHSTHSPPAHRRLLRLRPPLMLLRRPPSRRLPHAALVRHPRPLSLQRRHYRRRLRPRAPAAQPAEQQLPGGARDLKRARAAVGLRVAVDDNVGEGLLYCVCDLDVPFGVCEGGGEGVEVRG